MKRIAFAALWLVALAAIGAVSASSAFASEIKFVGKSATTYAVREHNCKVPKPASVAKGEQMLMMVYAEDPEGTGAFTLSSSGWTLVEKKENKSSGIWFQIDVFTKTYEEGDPSEYTVSWTGTNKRGCGALAAAWSGVSTSEPINAHLGAASEGATTTVRGPSITTTKANSMVVMLGDYNAADTRTAPSGMEDVAGPEGVIAQVLQPEAKATGNKDAKTGHSDANVGFLVGLTPESGEPPPAPTVTKVSPSTGFTGGGTSVTVTGTNLSGASAVKFGSTNATSYTVNSSTSITATSPSGSGTVDVTVTTGSGTSSTSSADHFTYVEEQEIKFVGKSATTYAVREHNCKVPKPASVAKGEQMLMMVYAEDPEGTGAFTLSSSGWTLVEKKENKSSGIWFQIDVFTKTYEEGDPSEYTVSWTGTNKRGCGALAAAWSGVSTSEPINAHLGAASEGATTTVRGPSITTTKANSMVVMLGDYNAADTRTAPSGMEDVAGPEGVIAQVLQPEAKATGNKDAKTGHSDANVGFLVGLTPGP